MYNRTLRQSFYAKYTMRDDRVVVAWTPLTRTLWEIP
jgi:hypothetical protein